MKCSKCGFVIKDETETKCPKCWTPLPQSDYLEDINKKAPKNKPFEKLLSVFKKGL